MKNIYLDNAATTKVREEVIRAMSPYWSEKYGNPSSLHSYGREAREVVENSRHECAKIIGCSSNEIIFTSGGTESNNLALNGAIRSGQITNLIVSQSEHPSVLSVAESIVEVGNDVKFCEVDENAQLKIDVFNKLLSTKSLCSIIYANNEVGTINPISEIGELVHSNQSYLHTDACQAAGYLNINVDELNVDMMSLNGSKINGPKGVGLLYIKEETPFHSPNMGGGQEYGLRGGTENVPGIVGFAKALSLASNEKAKESQRIKSLRDELINQLTKHPKITLLGSAHRRLPNNACFLFRGIDTQALLMKLDEFGISCSVASACSSEQTNPSHVLLAMGLGYEISFQSLRFSLGRYNNIDEIKYVVRIISKLIKE